MAPMSVKAKLDELQDYVSSDCQILLDDSAPAFKKYSKRWTDIDRQIPAGIVLPTSEDDIIKIVRWAVKKSIPYVVKSGGGSEWSTIDGKGFILDLTQYSSISVDVAAQTVTISGGVTTKELASALAEKGLFTALGNGNQVGVSGFVLGGGLAITNSITGFGSDNIITARLISPSSELYLIREDTQPDTMWAIRGAGHFFGIVTELVLKAYPLSALGNPEGTIWQGHIAFPLDRAKEVAEVMKDLINDDRYATSGMIMITAPPLTGKEPTLLISARYTGDPTKVEEAYKPLRDLKPLSFEGSQVPIQNVSDGKYEFFEKGDFKSFGIAGLHHFHVDRFLQTIPIWQELIKECPDAANTSFNFQWDSRPVKKPSFDSAMSFHDLRFWQNNYIWYTDPSSRSKVEEYNKKCIDTVRGPDEKEWVDYQNGTRSGPIGRRFRGDERVDRLRKVKQLWDPKGIFTSQLLD